MIETWYSKATRERLLHHSAPGTLAQRNLIVLHITAGSTAAGAIATFRASIAPHRVSAHFVIDRDGMVIQLLPLEETAWHASHVNSRSVGIEHVAVPHTMMATDAQYESSAEIVAWLCVTLKVPCDRNHVQGHNECSPADRHTLCPTGALDPDRVVQSARSMNAQ